MSQPSASLGRLLKEYRERKGLTLFEMAKEIGGPSIQFVCDVESGRRPFPETRLKRWSSALGIDPVVVGGFLISKAVSDIERRSGCDLYVQVVPKNKNYSEKPQSQGAR